MADRPDNRDVADAAELRDWYLEDGRVVFTEAYHLKRGYCCGNACRHCPFRDGDEASPSRERAG